MAHIVQKSLTNDDPELNFDIEGQQQMQTSITMPGSDGSQKEGSEVLNAGAEVIENSSNLIIEATSEERVLED